MLGHANRKILNFDEIEKIAIVTSMHSRKSCGRILQAGMAAIGVQCSAAIKKMAQRRRLPTSKV
jgi:hypothetical protein